MAKQAPETDKREAAAPAETATAGQAETASAAPKADKATPKPRTNPAIKGRMVEAKLRARHCRGGICKEKGQTMRMTAGEYERLKRHGRVE
ncbi:hypothetical protein SAMN04487957_110136 [Halomonas shengliensis]|uniref:Uncharacterized protein n=1 Tax=Halomonas shengliensis TaxID=419597 RepID=A0A1H0LWL6_9GAMM|nr:hypothetical protein [Halomonas shengliensis]SDO72608.1 hypothetical protein SAMN04487957_110136 [Halomonas shengliensis]